MPRQPACRGPVHAVCAGAQLRLRPGLLVQQAHAPGEAAARRHAGVQLQHLPLRLADRVVQQRAARSPAPHRLQRDRKASTAVPVNCRDPSKRAIKACLVHTLAEDLYTRTGKIFKKLQTSQAPPIWC